MNNTQQNLEWSHPHADITTPQVVATLRTCEERRSLKRRCEAKGRGNLNPAESKSVCSFERVIDASLRSRRLLRFARKDGRLSRHCEAEGRGNLKTGNEESLRVIKPEAVSPAEFHVETYYRKNYFKE